MEGYRLTLHPKLRGKTRMYTTIITPNYLIQRHEIISKPLKRNVSVDIYLPDNLLGNEHLHLLLLNDGQDMEQLGLKEILTELYVHGKIDPIVVVALHAGADRINEYGIVGHPDFKSRGKKAGFFNKFLFTELLPFIDSLALRINGKRAYAGWSLGGLTALDTVIRNPNSFTLSGIFSGAFWWRSRDLADGYTDNDRIMHQIIRKEKWHPGLKFWLMTGTEDETTDRNQNFIIDSIDDTIDVIKELVKSGYRRPEDITYYEAVGGKHNIETWAQVMPAFLVSAFGK